MRLNFKTKYPFDPTRETEFQQKISDNLKIHTLREDSAKRWREGLKIEMANGSRYKPNIFNTKDVCRAVQEVVISIPQVGHTNQIVIAWPLTLQIEVDGRILSEDECRAFWKNDGFDDLSDFLNWFFPDGFEREKHLRLIHWTDKMY